MEQTKNVLSDVKTVPENGGYPLLEVPWRGYPDRTHVGRWGVPHPVKSPGQAPPTQKNQWGVGAMDHFYF